MSDPVIRLLVSDVDGTLVRHDKSIGDATVAAAHKLIAAGGAMTLISARPPSGVLPLARKLGLVHPIGAFNGGTIVRMDGTIVEAHHIAADASREAIEIIQKAGVCVWAFVDSKWYADTAVNSHYPRERLSAMIDEIIVDDFDSFHGRIDKIVAVTDDKAEMDAVEDALKTALGARANVACSQAYYCDITHPLANKGDGIAFLTDTIGIPLSETAAIGDMPNDIPMLVRAALPIAMGQAKDAVKQVARQVSASNNEDGVGVAIERFILPALPKVPA